jgi:intraflagellar transport protein 52
MSNLSIIFNLSKKESANPNANMSKIGKELKAQNYQLGLNKQEITEEKVKKASLLLIGAPHEMFSKAEFDTLKNHIETGGKILILMSEGGENKMGTNLNYLLEQFGISVNNDCVVRTSFFKYFNPKEAYVSNGILNQEVVRVANNLPKEERRNKPNNAFLSNLINVRDEEGSKEEDNGGLSFVYPFGASLNIEQPAFALLGSGPLSYPSNRPVCAAYVHPESKGKLVVLGSAEIFCDPYFDKEENKKLLNFLLKFFFTEEVEIDQTKDITEFPEYQHVPDVAEMAEKLKSCLQESEDLPRDFTTLYDETLFKYDTNLVPDSLALYDQLNVKHEMLTLIPPQFETPMLGLQPAVFPPILRELPAPNLELFDLDEEFASEKVRLAQVTNKCNTAEDLDYFVKECGDILGVSDKVKNKNDPKAIISYILEQLVSFKKLNQS